MEKIELEEHDKKIRNEAINEFAELLKHKLMMKYGSETSTEQDVAMQVSNLSNEIARQMNEGKIINAFDTTEKMLAQIVNQTEEKTNVEEHDKKTINKAINEFADLLRCELITRYGNETSTVQDVVMQVFDWCYEIVKQINEKMVVKIVNQAEEKVIMDGD